MKKLIFLIMLLIIPFNIKALSAQSAILIDGDSGRILYQKNANTPHLIASTSKIMTALVAIENGTLDKKVTIGEEILKSYGSGIYVEIGEKITLKDLIYGLMLRSGNDAALAIATNVSKNEEDFVKLMNQKAQELNMTKTIFINPHGLEDNNGNGNTSTAYDMAILMKEAMNNKTFAKITSTKKYIVKTNKKTYVWHNKNKLLTNYKYTIGGKTGFTKKARRTLVTVASKNKKKLIAVTLNDPNDFANHEALYEEYFKKYELVTIITKSKSNLSDKEYKNKTLYLKKDIKLLMTKEEKKNYQLNINYYKKDKFKNTNIAGIIQVKLNNNIILEENIYYKDKIIKNSILDKLKKLLK